MPPREAAVVGSRETAFTVLSMSLSLIAVFIPILLMGGVVGRLFREFAVTLAMAVAISLVLSLTTTPVMCAALLRPHGEQRQGRLSRASERVFDALHGAYARTLPVALHHRRITFAIAIGMVGLNIWMFTVVPKGFFPSQDTGRLSGAIQADESISFQAMRGKLAQAIDIVAKDPAIESVIGFTGGGGGGGSTRNSARMFIALKPLDQRGESALDVIGRLRGPLSHIPGAPAFLQPVQDIRVGGRQSNAQYQYTLTDGDLNELDAWSPRVERALRKLPELADFSSDQQNKGLESQLLVDRATASRLGLTASQIDAALYDAFGQREVSVIYRLLNQYHVVMEVAPHFWQSPETLRQLTLATPTGDQIPLLSFSRYAPGMAPLAVSHQGQFPAVTFSFNLAPDTALGRAVDAIDEATRQMRFPAGLRGSFQGTAQAFQSSLSNEPLLILAALITVYIVLGVLYESYVHPITILSTLPSAGVGALLALWLTGSEFTVIALIGIVLLIGIVKKNAIMMIDFALEAERSRKLAATDAIYEACLLRFRPILMTTLAALLGALPLAVGAGMGAEMRRPLGISIVGGLLVSQLLTLYTTPVVYLYLDRLHGAVRPRAFWRRK